jgi:hypothetical protein
MEGLGAAFDTAATTLPSTHGRFIQDPFQALMTATQTIKEEKRVQQQRPIKWSSTTQFVSAQQAVTTKPPWR